MMPRSMSLHSIDIGIFAAYILALVGIGWLATRRAAGTKRDYFLAGDKLPWWMVGGSIVASNISSHHLVGVVGLAYSIGFAAMTVEWGAILLGFNALLWIFLPFYIRNGFYTMPEFLDRRFGRAARTTYGGLILLTYLFVEISAVLVLGALALSTLFGLSAPWSVVVLASLTGLTTIAGGLRAVVWTEMLQLAVLLLGGIVLAVVTLIAVGGPERFLSTSTEWKLLLPASDETFPWTMFLGGIPAISIFYCAANQFIVQRVLAAKDEWHARMGVVFTDYLKLLLPIIIVVPGMMARQLYPDLEKGDLAFPTLVRNLLPAGLSGLVLAALIAATMSHVSGALNSCSTILTIDFYLPYRKGATEAGAVRFGKVTAVVALVTGAFWALWLLSFTEKSMFKYLLEAYGFIAPGVATMFLLGIFWRRTTHAGALAAGSVTIPLSIALEVFLPQVARLARASIVFWSCMAACFLVSLLTRPRPEAEIRPLLWNLASLRAPAGAGVRRGWAQSPFLWWAIVNGIVAFFYVKYGLLAMGGDAGGP
jgi:SSS family solute:Na+ symporter